MTISNVFSSAFSDLTIEIASLFAKPQDSHPVGYIFYFFLLLEFCALHQEHCSAVALGHDVYQSAVYIAMAVRIRVFDHTLVEKHVHSREEVQGSNPCTPKFLRRDFAASWHF